jgi:VWFA-related protein
VQLHAIFPPRRLLQAGRPGVGRPPANPMRILLPTLILAAAAQMWPQRTPQAATLSVNVNVVTLLATVHDRNGRIVNHLDADDFVLEEDGKPQKIRYFSRESDMPLTVGLLVDTSRSQQGVLAEESRASNTFLEQVLRADKDEAFVAHFDTRVDVLQGLTSSRSELSAALGQLAIPDEVATLMFSAVRQCSADVMRGQAGRKAFILLTDGVAYKDPTSMETAIEFAQQADTILYSIRFSDPVAAYRPFRAAILEAAKEHGKSELERMAKETGGVSYEVRKDQTIEAIYAEIEDALRNQYSIGYTPPRQSPDGKFHKIKLISKDRSLHVTTRTGYYSK